MELFDLFKTILTSNGGAFAIVVAFLLFIFWVYGKFLKILHDHQAFEKRCADLESKVNAINENIVYIKGMMNIFMNRNGRDEMMQANSPLALTEKGKNTASGFRAEEIIARNWDEKILPQMDRDLIDRNPYDVQQYCLERIPVVPALFISGEDLTIIKTYAFANGLPLFSCLKILGLLVRDAYLKSHGIAIDEIDKHSPKV